MSIFDVPSGTKEQRLISVPGFGAELPVTVIRGKVDGTKVLITAGIHNEEYSGIETANRLAIELTPEEISGCVCIIHICNPTGFATQSRDVVPEDGKNLNRCFPPVFGEGNSASYKLAQFISENFLKHASYYIDLHCGGGREELTPHVYFQGIELGVVSKTSQKLAALMDANYMVQANTYSGSAFSHAAFHGVPSILLERGGMALWSESEIRLYLADIRRVLHTLGILPNSEVQKSIPRIIETVHYFNSEADGLWYPALHPGDIAQKGDCLGVVKDVFGQPLCTVTASVDSVILYQVGSLSVTRGEFLIACGQL